MMSDKNSTVMNEASERVPQTKSVEGQLWKTLQKLAETEGVIKLLSTLKLLGLATNDVHSFVVKQVIHKKVCKKIDNKVKKVAMESKLRDAYAYAKRLRQDKNKYKNRLLKKYLSSKSYGKQVLSDLVWKYRDMKSMVFKDVESKVTFLKEKHELNNKLYQI